MRSTRGALAAGIVAFACLAFFVEWLANMRDVLPGPAEKRTWILYQSLSMANATASPAGAVRILAGIALAGAASSLLALFIFWRAPHSAPARQVGYVLVAYALYTIFMQFAWKSPRYGDLDAAWSVAGYGALWLMLLGIARFLVIFPRSVDAESVSRTYWYRVSAGPRVTPSLLHAWHRALVDGRPLWMIAALMMAAAALPTLGPGFPLGLWGGVAFVVGTVSFGFLLFAGYPFAFASTTHLYRNGTDDDRRRVRWLRAVLLGAALLVAAIAACSAGMALIRPGPEVSFRILGGIFVGLALLPTAFIAALAFAVLYGGALDPRVAITRVSVWTILGIGVTLLFLVLERYVAVQVVEWLGLPRETGLVAAGAVIAATFVPVRKVVERGVTRLAERYLPLEVVADGARVDRVVAITDLSGYTALSAIDEPRALLLGALLKRQGDRVASRYGGRLVKSMGDAVMLTFASAGSALAAVRELHAAFVPAADAIGAEPLPLHSALHRGEIVESHDGDIYGQTVNVTARLVDAAGKGEIVVSGALADALPERPALDDIGERSFKNVPQPLRCYRLGAGLIAPDSSAATPAPAP